jgi:hypothetical protein
VAILWAKQITHPEKIFCNPWSYILSHPLKILSSYPILIGNVQNGIFAVIRLFWVRKKITRKNPQYHVQGVQYLAKVKFKDFSESFKALFQ